MDKLVLSFVRYTRPDHHTALLYGAIACQLIPHAVFNGLCNWHAICLHAVYKSHMTTLSGCLARILGNAGQAVWPFA